jgi:hypothetical protein
VTRPLSKSDRALLSEFATRLEIPVWHTRSDPSGPCFIVGSNSVTIRPEAGRLVMTIRPTAPASIQPARRQLLTAKILRLDPDDRRLAFLRLPETPDEIEATRNLIGLPRRGPAPAACMPCVAGLNAG